MFLTEEEIKELTHYELRKYQAIALRSMGIEHRIRPDGSLAVLRSHVDKIMGGGLDVTHTQEVEPNWDGINA